MSSPHRNSPAITASTTPAVTPMASPMNARCSDAARCVCSSPVSGSSHPACSTCDGAARVRSSTTPVELSSCHPASSSTGPVRRRTSAGTRWPRARRATGHASWRCGVVGCLASRWLTRRGHRAGRGRDEIIGDAVRGESISR